MFLSERFVLQRWLLSRLINKTFIFLNLIKANPTIQQADFFGFSTDFVEQI